MSAGRLSKREFPWVMQMLLDGRPLKFARIDDLPEEAAKDKETFGQNGLKSFVAFPLSAAGRSYRGQWLLYPAEPSANGPHHWYSSWLLQRRFSPTRSPERRPIRSSVPGLQRDRRAQTTDRERECLPPGRSKAGAPPRRGDRR